MSWQVPGYTQVAELGSGAFGRVVLAVRDADPPSDGEHIAIKYLNERLLGDPRFVADFAAEAMLLRELRSPHVVQLHEYVRSPDGAAIVMAYVDGIDLRRVLDQHGPTAPEAALVVLRGSLLGLAAAHHAGVVHRDYKPANVLVTHQGQSILVDFGIAVRSGDVASAQGTPAYMAPEQWSSGTASPSADVYAATAVFFECLTGHKPYSAPSLEGLAAQHRLAPIPAGQVPQTVRDLLRRGLAKDPADRPLDAAAFATDLEAAATEAYGPDWAERGARALAAALLLLSTTVLPDGASTGPPTGSAPGKTVLGRATRPNAVKAIVASAAAAVAVAGGYAVIRESSSTDPTPATTRPPAVTTQPPTPKQTPIPPGAIVGRYTLALKSLTFVASLNLDAGERAALRRLVKRTMAKPLTIRSVGGGFQICADRCVTLKRIGERHYRVSDQDITFGPADVQDGRVIRFTIRMLLHRTIDGVTRRAAIAIAQGTRS